ncbi:amino acid ABC transporter substrate-binding protein [Alkalihalobacillus sp. 1P02AB]|uniref:amino acid ABC transporter substrate-binding protein n=1 Tax=Alkalihalobacillus sp. 1P02AB TaxID=3132260 RepID=UPI0039A4AF19
MKKRFLLMLGMIVLVSMIIVGCSGEEATTDDPANDDGTETTETTTGSGGKLAEVMDRGHLVLGSNNTLPGFGYLNSAGEEEGFDVEFGQVMAAAIFGDKDAIEYRPLSAQERFTAVQSGEVDVLIRNTTWTLTRDVEVGLAFGPTTFYDGQGMMVPADAGFTTLEDLQGARIGVEQGTTTELNLTDQMRARGVDFEPVLFADRDSLIAAYESGTVDAWTTDQSGLVASYEVLADPDGHVIMDVVLSKEPLGPAVLDGDTRFFEVMYWSVMATIQAEEFGMTSENVDDFLDSEDPDIQRFLGVEPGNGAQLGLEEDFAYQIIKQVGNYGEIFDRNIGTESPFNLERGLNALYTDGGILYSPPFR